MATLSRKMPKQLRESVNQCDRDVGSLTHVLPAFRSSLTAHQQLHISVGREGFLYVEDFSTLFGSKLASGRYRLSSGASTPNATARTHARRCRPRVHSTVGPYWPLDETGRPLVKMQALACNHTGVHRTLGMAAPAAMPAHRLVAKTRQGMMCWSFAL